MSTLIKPGIMQFPHPIWSRTGASSVDSLVADGLGIGDTSKFVAYRKRSFSLSGPVLRGKSCTYRLPKGQTRRYYGSHALYIFRYLVRQREDIIADRVLSAKLAKRPKFGFEVFVYELRDKCDRHRGRVSGYGWV